MKLLDLAQYRKVNGLSQKDVSSILNVSRAYVSQVEVGTNNLSDEKIDRLLFENDEIYEDTYVLVPAFKRLKDLCYSLKQKYEALYFSLVNVEGANERYEPLLGILTRDTILSIRHGRMPITEAVADSIIRAFPAVNQGWLTTGQGGMYNDETEIRLAELHDVVRDNKITLKELQSEIAALREDYKTISSAIEEIRGHEVRLKNIQEIATGVGLWGGRNHAILQKIAEQLDVQIDEDDE